MKIREINLFFPEVVFTKILNEIDDTELEKLNKEVSILKYVKSGLSKDIQNNNTSFSSDNRYIFSLPEFNNLKNIILNEFNKFKNNTLKYNSNNFVYTTSWATKSLPNQKSDYHNHANCFYSGIFYLNTDKDCGDLVFNNFNIKGFNVIPTEYNDYNSPSYRIKPKNKLLTFFPSHLVHRIALNTSNITRYSIAFNFIPVNKIGEGDSELILNI